MADDEQPHMTWHPGADVPGLMGMQVPILVMAGERIRTRSQEEELTRRLARRARYFREHPDVTGIDDP